MLLSGMLVEALFLGIVLLSLTIHFTANRITCMCVTTYFETLLGGGTYIDVWKDCMMLETFCIMMPLKYASSHKLFSFC